MPIYEYRCTSCGYENEYLQRVSEPQLTDCPDCGKATFTKLISAAGFQLKGNGWYATDFKNNGSKPKADKPKDEGETTKKDESKAEPACGTGACPACS